MHFTLALLALIVLVLLMTPIFTVSQRLLGLLFMTHLKSSRMFANFALLVSALFLLQACATHEQTTILPKYTYTSSETATNQIDAMLTQAKTENKLAMVVLGASWCHDSVGLQQNFSNPKMHALLEEKYVTRFIDVGYLDDLRHITQRFGYPAYFGTPTVLVIEPHTQTLLNHEQVSIWQSADSVPFDEYVAHFQSFSLNESTPTKSPAVNHQALADFEQAQIQRLFAAYAILGPQLQADEEGTLEDKDAFYTQWRSVYQFRTQLQADLVALKQQAYQSAAQGNEVNLSFPEYPPFAWE
ncbi:thioredoxin family protein [Glaciecola sp. XM2]|uniref:thioredoxin family protein n=1 Tax=Glaciecola sp. XM2 TaxID=1914931 RepID=UPI001BDE08B2|nr:thioredoxin family protein [Glaciecola sp. XM2]MBT1450142.1 thioredoxin family protein [Glaciecola sp. XM2]